MNERNDAKQAKKNYYFIHKNPRQLLVQQST